MRCTETELFPTLDLSERIAVSTLAVERMRFLQMRWTELERSIVKRFEKFEDAALFDRLENLDRAEVDLQKRVAARMSQLRVEDRWVPSDPLFQQLSGVLKRIRDDMREAEEEVLLRGRISAARKAA